MRAPPATQNGRMTGRPKRSKDGQQFRRGGYSSVTMRGWPRLLLSAILLSVPSSALAQEASTCRFICELQWKVEPTFTIENLANRHRTVTPDGVIELANRDWVFEAVLALDFKTKLPRLGFTAEAIAAPFSDDNSLELELETNFYW